MKRLLGYDNLRKRFHGLDVGEAAAKPMAGPLQNFGMASDIGQAMVFSQRIRKSKMCNFNGKTC